MDRSQITSILTRAQHRLELATGAQGLSVELRTPAALTVRGEATVGDESSTLHILTPASLVWSPNFYVRTFFDGLGAEEQLTAFISATAEIPGMIQKVRAGQGNILKRLLNPTAAREAEQAAFDLMVMLDQTDAPAQDIGRLLNAADQARTSQHRGVQLFPGIHGVGQRFLDAAHRQLAGTLGVADPDIFPWQGTELARARSIVQAYTADPNSEVRLRREAEHTLDQLNRDHTTILMAQLPVDALRTATDHRLRFGPLDSLGIATVADVLRTSQSLLTSVNGIGVQTAQRMKAAAQTLEREALSRQTLSIGDTPSRAAIALVRILARFEQAETLTPAERERRTRIIDYVQKLPTASEYIIAGSGPDRGRTAFARLTDDLAWVSANPNLFHPRSITDPGPAIWSDYLSRPAHFQALLGTLLGRDIEGADEHLDATILQRIREMDLDHTLVHDLHLRGYQSFGARFSIVQKKILLGDDMGLGKTVQALSVAAHLTATEKDFRTLVVVPASVIVNWVRECRRFTHLSVFVAHGEGKEEAVTAWSSSTGILICTYDGARTLNLPAPGLIIADEAHMIKNPATKRSQACAKLIESADYALLMTGTPLENKVSEFVSLIRYIQPALITRGMSTMSADDFRARIAPAYLRRNQADVLDELPERTDSIDWIDLSTHDRAAYDGYVREGNWMGMRRSAMLASAGGTTAKMERIIELLDEAEEHGRKSLIFTFFLDVLDELERVLGSRVIGRISGQVPATQRQELVDALSTAPAGSALIAQITAGGVGLNIQSASQVIICEPQVKPTIEQQAVARVHRMGQTATVNVHRLIGDDTADERMLEILAGKEKIFDVYARLSESAEIPDAVDITEAQLAANIIDAERARLGLGTDQAFR